MAILLTCWSLLIGPALCLGEVLAHPCECVPSCQECSPSEAQPRPCHGDPCRSTVADKPALGREESPSAAISFPTITEFTIAADAFVAMPPAVLAGGRPDMAPGWAEPPSTARVLPLLI